MNTFIILLLSFFSFGRSFRHYKLQIHQKSFSKLQYLPQNNEIKSNYLSLVDNPLQLNIVKNDKSLKTEVVEVVEDNKLSINTARGILLAVSALYGTNFACVKILGESLNPSVAAMLRFTVAALVFLPQLLKISKTNPKLIMGGFEVGIYSALGYWGQAVALQTSSASNTAFICSLAVIVVPILNVIFHKEKTLNKPWYETLLPAILAVMGVGCLELGGVSLPTFSDLYAFSQPLFFGLGFWRIEQLMKLTQGEDGETQAFTGAMLIVVALFSIFWSIYDISHISNNSLILHFINTQFQNLKDWHVLAAIGWTGIMTTALTSYGENVAMKRLSAAESTVIYSTEPLWGTLFAFIVLNEQIGWNTIVGAFLIISACLWSTLGPTISIAGMISSSTLSEEGFEQIYNNMIVNFLDLINRIAPIISTQIPPDM